MRRILSVLLLVVFALLWATAQGPRQALTFSTAGFVSSVEMSGTALWHYGSDEQTGSVVLKANANGESRTELRLNRGTRVETQNAFTDADRTCKWSGFDGVEHDIASHNCLLSTVWFLPQINMQLGAGAPGAVLSAAVSADGKTVRLHYERRFVKGRKAQMHKVLAQLSAVDLEIDANTGLARSLLFSGHPDNDAGTDIPTEVQFSDYRNIQGVMVPFRIQKLVNHSLVLDLQISDATISFGASVAGPSTSAAQRNFRGK